MALWLTGLICQNYFCKYWLSFLYAFDFWRHDSFLIWWKLQSAINWLCDIFPSWFDCHCASLLSCPCTAILVCISYFYRVAQNKYRLQIRVSLWNPNYFWRSLYPPQGHLHTYRFCDNVWTFILQDATFKNEDNPENVGRVKIVACDSKLLTQWDAKLTVATLNKNLVICCYGGWGKCSG